MSQITNREKFSYDVDSDNMFQQFLSSMMKSGASAMQDTMGQASMLTGGYGSSYATSAANQAYNAYIEDAYANLPDYYNMALNAYQMEGEELYKQFSMYSDADAKEYARMLDSYQIGWDEAMHIYDKGYTEYQDTITNAFNAMNVAQGEADRLYKNEWDLYLDEQSRYSNIAQMQNSDYWRTEDMNWQKEQADEEHDRWLAQNDLNGDGVVDRYDHEYEYQRKYDSDGDGVIDDEEDNGYDTLTDAQWERVKKVYTENGGGAKGEDAVAQGGETRGVTERKVRAERELGVEKGDKGLRDQKEDEEEHNLVGYIILQRRILLMHRRL
jgi:hypothetical protein